VLTRARHPRRPARLVPSPTEAEMARALSAARPEFAATRGQSATIPAKGAPGRSPPRRRARRRRAQGPHDAVRMGPPGTPSTPSHAPSAPTTRGPRTRPAARSARRSPPPPTSRSSVTSSTCASRRFRPHAAARLSPPSAPSSTRPRNVYPGTAHASSTASRPRGSAERYGRRPNPAAIPPVLGLDFRRRLPISRPRPPANRGASAQGAADSDEATALGRRSSTWKAGQHRSWHL